MVFLGSIIVSTGYLLLSLISIIQLFRILLYGHKLLSFATYFLLLCLSWSITRCLYFGFGFIYFALNERDNLLLFYIPTILQFATFSFILVYYEKHIKKQQVWRQSKCYIICTYIFSILFLAIINILSLYYCFSGKCNSTHNKIANRIHYISFGVFYTFLVLFYCIYVRRLWKHHNLYYYSNSDKLIANYQDVIVQNGHNSRKTSEEDNINHPQNENEQQQHSFSSFIPSLLNQNTKQIDKDNVTLHGKSKAFFSLKFVFVTFIIFLTRCIYFFILSTGVWTDSLNEINNNLGVAAVFCIVFWEWLPTIVILAFFRKIPSTDLCCPICFHFDEDDLEDNTFRCYCCCFCCCCRCLNRNNNKSVTLSTPNNNSIFGIQSDTSRSIQDISYYNKSPPAPVIQKLIYKQQQQAHIQSYTSQTITQVTYDQSVSSMHKECSV